MGHASRMVIVNFATEPNYIWSTGTFNLGRKEQKYFGGNYHLRQKQNNLILLISIFQKIKNSIKAKEKWFERRNAENVAENS